MTTKPRFHVTRATLVAACVLLTVAGLLAAGCCTHEKCKEQAKRAPDLGETLPEWAFDAPYYFQPPSDVLPQPASRPAAGCPTHYNVNRPVVLVARPENEVDIDLAPRIAVYWTNNNGCVWTRAGYFGLGQALFSFVAGEDGDYGIRFVGPGIRESLTERTIPHRVYHLDTVVPKVDVELDPDQYEYHTGDAVTVRWTAHDANLDERSVRLNICWSLDNPDMMEPDQPEIGTLTSDDTLAAFATRQWKPYKLDCAPDDVVLFTIPPQAEGQVFQFQVRAKDKAGNYGVDYSCPIFVNNSGAADEHHAHCFPCSHHPHCKFHHSHHPHGKAFCYPALATTTRPA